MAVEMDGCVVIKFCPFVTVVSFFDVVYVTMPVCHMRLVRCRLNCLLTYKLVRNKAVTVENVQEIVVP